MTAPQSELPVVVCVGASSFLFGSVRKRLEQMARLVVKDRERGWPREVHDARWVLSFAWPTEARSRVVERQERTLDAQLIESLPTGCSAGYVMLSTRAVYDHAPASLLSEDTPIAPASAYGANKARAEREARAACAAMERGLTILRVSNAFGFEYPAVRHTFASTMLHGLATDGCISVDGDMSRIKDLMPVAAFGDVLGLLLQRMPTTDCEIFNVGSGVAMPIGEIAQAIVRGYGSGSVVRSGREAPKDRPFVLDVTKLRGVLGDVRSLRLSRADVDAALELLGKRLREA